MSDDPLELPLFDRPPGRSAAEPETADPGAGPGADGDDEIDVEILSLDPDRSPAPPAATPAEPATLGPRLAAGIIDLMVHAALLGILVGGSSALGVAVGSRHAMPLAIVLLLFSFLYHVVPLAFWGNTPGMAVAGLRARSLNDEPLSLPQAVRRWLALLLTAATLGLGTLVALSGRSLADRLSDSRTVLQ
ncbi:MAG: RDD family protein [Acidobacteriota bacterium]|nr:RDD family protein [Acidobacteriota bacterium]MDH3525084.1 RDD family protein [Acidobacteriota bacterium]